MSLREAACQALFTAAQALTILLAFDDESLRFAACAAIAASVEDKRSLPSLIDVQPHPLRPAMAILLPAAHEQRARSDVRRVAFCVCACLTLPFSGA